MLLTAESNSSVEILDPKRVKDSDSAIAPERSLSAIITSVSERGGLGPPLRCEDHYLPLHPEPRLKKRGQAA